MGFYRSGHHDRCSSMLGISKGLLGEEAGYRYLRAIRGQCVIESSKYRRLSSLISRMGHISIFIYAAIKLI